MGTYITYCFNIYIVLAKNISIFRFFSFEAMTISQIFPRRLGKLNFDPFNGKVSNF